MPRSRQLANRIGHTHLRHQEKVASINVATLPGSPNAKSPNRLRVIDQCTDPNRIDISPVVGRRVSPPAEGRPGVLRQPAP